MKRIGLLHSYSEDTTELAAILNGLAAAYDYQIRTLLDAKIGSSILNGIWELINSSDVLVAYVTGNSGSLYYEIGLAHGVGKPVIFVVKNEEMLPWDFSGQRFILLDSTKFEIKHIQFQLKEAIEDATKNESSHYLGPRHSQLTYSSNCESNSSINFKDILAKTGAKRAVLFEQWFADLASGVNGWEVIQSAISNRQDRGFDLVIWNSLEDSELSILGNPIAFELRAVRSMNTKDLAAFLSASKKAGVKGMIMATTGINDKTMKNRLHRLRIEEEINVILLDRDDLVKVENSNDLLFLIKSKVQELLYNKEL